MAARRVPWHRSLGIGCCEDLPALVTERSRLRRLARARQITRMHDNMSESLCKQEIGADACCAGHWTGNGADGAAEFVRAPGNGH